MENDMEEEPERAVCPCPFAGVANHDCNYRVLCGYSSDENLGDGFIAFDGDTELFLRVGYDSKPSLDIVQKESVFLCKAENLNLNLERWLARVHSAIEIEGDFLLNVFYRPGPSLRQLRQFSNFKPFSYATVGRFSADIFNILHAVHKTNYLMCDIDDDMLYFDTNTRSLFLGEFASVCINPLGMKTSDLKWDGPAHLAPLRSHLGRRLTQSDELESTFYFIVSLIRQLPWQETSEDDMGRHKFEACRVTNKLLKMLPGQYSVMHKLIDETQKLSAECGHSKPIDDSVYKELANLALRIAQEEGGMKSMDDPFVEFEHEPTNAMKEESDEGFTFEPIDVENVVFGTF